MPLTIMSGVRRRKPFSGPPMDVPLEDPEDRVLVKLTTTAANKPIVVAFRRPEPYSSYDIDAALLQSGAEIRKLQEAGIIPLADYRKSAALSGIHTIQRESDRSMVFVIPGHLSDAAIEAARRNAGMGADERGPAPVGRGVAANTLDRLPVNAAEANAVVQIRSNVNLANFPFEMPALRRIVGNVKLAGYEHSLPALNHVWGNVDGRGYEKNLPALTQIDGSLNVAGVRRPSMVPSLVQVSGDLIGAGSSVDMDKLEIVSGTARLEGASGKRGRLQLIGGSLVANAETSTMPSLGSVWGEVHVPGFVGAKRAIEAQLSGRPDTIADRIVSGAKRMIGITFGGPPEDERAAAVTKAAAARAAVDSYPKPS